MTAFEYLKKTEQKRHQELFSLLRFPSVSAKSEHKQDLIACAKWLVNHFQKIGFTAKTFPTKGHPIVYAEYIVDKKLPTVLYYGHYDVQPPEPLELWKTKPFDPEVDGSTSIVGYLSKTCHVTARVFDFAGNHVVTLVEDELMTHELDVTWAGADQDGTPVANGVYFCHVEADDGSKVTTAVVKIAVLRGSSD